ncbi:MAG TPA: sugar ABC transporter permease [Ktedonosporobacter sp.]|nr:sugar ABC transporter permease [Ktedonosporobacter sp.]
MATRTASTRADRGPTLLERIQAGGGFSPYLLILPTMIVILAIAVYPMLDSLWISLLDNPLLGSPVLVGFANYAHVLGDPIFQSALVTTIIFTLMSVTLEILLGLGLAVLINKPFRGRTIVRASILVPWAFPTIVSAQMWLLMYNDQIGIITTLLQGLHLLAPGDTMLGSYWGVMLAALITDIWKTTPFAALLLLAGLQVIPAELYEAASVDGSSPWQQFWQITLPMLRNQLLITLLFRALDAVRVFDLFYAFGGNKVPSMAVYANIKMFAGTPGDFAPGVAASVIIFIIGVLISLILVPMMRDIMKQPR